MRWYDSRVKTPSCNSFDCFYVLFAYCQSVFIGFGDWMPRDGYKEGDWQNIRTTNGNKMDGAQVLYWVDHPSDWPEVLKVD